jgi:hypothetical protein
MAVLTNVFYGRGLFPALKADLSDMVRGKGRVNVQILEVPGEIRL